MDRRIDYAQAAYFDSLGRNGPMTTLGCVVRSIEAPRRDDPTVLLMPVNSRGDLGRAQVSVTTEAAGDVGAAFVEAFCRYATQEARAALLGRLAVICDGHPDPAYRVPADEAPAPPPAPPRR